MGRLALKKPSTERKAKRGNKKLAARSLPGIWLWVYPRTGEHSIALESGEAIRVRIVHRLPEPNGWSADVDDRIGGPREMRLTSRLFAKHGHTEGCLGCAHKQAGLPDHRRHSAGCR